MLGEAIGDLLPSAVGVAKLLLGLVLLLVAVRQWRARPQDGQPAAMPKWMQALDGFTAGRSFAAGAALSGVNPKKLIGSAVAGFSD